MRNVTAFWLAAALSSAAWAQDTVAQPVQDNRAFGVLPNYRTVEGSAPFTPITSRRKLTIAWKDTMNPPSYVMGGLFSTVAQINNTHPSFGQGVKGFSQRYVTAVADQNVGNMLTEGFLPTLFHDDPRYFRSGRGGIWSRTGYALSRVLVTRSDRGNWRFNTSELLGTGMAASLGNLYYPDSRSGAATLERMSLQIGTDAFSNILKEFWPDVKRKLHRR